MCTSPSSPSSSSSPSSPSSAHVPIILDKFGFTQDILFDQGCSGNISCGEIKYFMKLISTPYDYLTGTYLPEEPLNKKAIMTFLNTDFRQKFLDEILNMYNHDCCIFNYLNIRMDAYEFLMENNIISIDKTHDTISMKHILYSLFLEVCPNWDNV
jgi:hypothetical protein